MIEVAIINQSAFELPAYATEGAAGLDVRANITEPIVLEANDRINAQASNANLLDLTLSYLEIT